MEWQETVLSNMGYSVGVDPIVDYNLSGEAYFSYLAVGSNRNSGIFIAKSINNGVDWIPEYTIAEYDHAAILKSADKPYMYIDKTPTSPFSDRIYSCYWLSNDSTAQSDSREILFAYIADGTLYGPEVVNYVANKKYVVNPIPSSDREGNLYLAYNATEYEGGEEKDRIKILKSTDGGETFDGLDGFHNEVTVAEINAIDPYPPGFQFRMNSFFTLDIDRSEGVFSNHIYVVWTEDEGIGNPTGQTNLYLSKSVDGGETWQVSLVLEESGEQFFPKITVDSQGTITLLYYHMKSPEDNAVYTRMKRSFDGGNTFIENEEFYFSFDPSLNYIDGFIGDYNGLATVDDFSFSVWTSNYPNSFKDNSGVIWGAQTPNQIPVGVQNLANEISNGNVKVDEVDYSSGTILKFVEDLGYDFEGQEYSDVGDNNTYKFRNWDNLFSENPSITEYHRISPDCKFTYDQYEEYVTSFGEPTQPLIINNCLEGGSVGYYETKWDKYGDYTSTVSGEVYNAFEWDTLRNDRYNLKVLPEIPDEYGVNWYFQNWTYLDSDDVILEPERENEAITAVNKDFTAVYKGATYTDHDNAFENNNQNKVVRTTQALYRTYESMDRIWLERSTDNGQTWLLENDGKHINNDWAWSTGHNPSLCLDYNSQRNFYLVYQESDQEDGHRIRVMYFNYNSYPPNVIDEIAPNTVIINEDSPIDMTPVIAKDPQNRLFVSFVVPPGSHKTVDNVSYQYSYGIYYHYAEHTVNDNSINWLNSNEEMIMLPSSSLHPRNPSLTVEHYSGTNAPFHIVWQEEVYNINYWTLTQDGSNEISTENFAVISDGSGFAQNTRPSISTRQERQVVSWMGSSGVPKSVYRGTRRSGEDWGNMIEDGENIRSSYIVGTNENTFVIAWSENNNGIYSNWFVHNWGHNDPKNFATDGRSVQMNNANNFDDMYGFACKTTEVPKKLQTSPGSVGDSLNTASSLLIAEGRKGVIYEDDTEFYFTLGNIKLDGQDLEFVNLPEFTKIKKRKKLNSFLKTEPFTVSDNSLLTFKIDYGFTDTLNSASFFDDEDFIRFKVQLVKANGNKVLAEYSAVTFNELNPMNEDNLNFSVSTDGLGGKNVRLCLKVEDNMDDVNYSLVKVYKPLSGFYKKSTDEFVLNSSTEIKEYSLEQNYPNPFNPSTNIEYSIPSNVKGEMSNVKLIIYDALGKEVAVLVDEAQVSGRYSINFNASQLSSGIYFYRLSAGEFSQSKKMLFLK